MLQLTFWWLWQHLHHHLMNVHHSLPLKTVVLRAQSERKGFWFCKRKTAQEVCTITREIFRLKSYDFKKWIFRISHICHRWRASSLPWNHFFFPWNCSILLLNCFCVDGTIHIFENWLCSKCYTVLIMLPVTGSLQKMRHFSDFCYKSWESAVTVTESKPVHYHEISFFSHETVAYHI